MQVATADNPVYCVQFKEKGKKKITAYHKQSYEQEKKKSCNQVEPQRNAMCIDIILGQL